MYQVGTEAEEAFDAIEALALIYGRNRALRVQASDVSLVLDVSRTFPLLGE